jgi:histone H3/H4
MVELPLAAMDRLLRKAGAGRVSEDAKAALAELLEEVAEDIGTEAIALARHAGRKTVKEEDIKLAAR